MISELSPDQKGQASLTLGEVIVQTRENFPDPRYRPQVELETSYYHRYGINPHPYRVWITADGIGTKPELAERLYYVDENPKHFEGLAYDIMAMIEGDVARFGGLLLGVAEIVDTNVSNPRVIAALARGAKAACDEGKFALLNGENAELGYRSSGYGETHVNWNAVGVYMVVPEKQILGTEIQPGQPIVALREKSIRSNGLTKARSILESAYLQKTGLGSKEGYFLSRLSNFLEYFIHLDTHGINPENQILQIDTSRFFNSIIGHGFSEQILIPWHNSFPELTKELLKPSKMFIPLISTAQGWIDGEKLVDITGAAHISGGGIPEKVHRMLESTGLGAHIDSVFPDPEAVIQLLEVARTLPQEGINLIDDRSACQQWNRGIGFAVVTRTVGDAKRLISLADELGYEAAMAGEILNEPKIDFRGHTWTY